MQTLDSAGNRSRRTSVASRHIKTSHSPCRRSISRAIAPRRTSVASQLIKASRSPCRRSISKAPAHDIRQGQHSTSKPAIPHVDARFYILSVEAHTTKVIFDSRNTSVASQQTPNQNQPFPMQMLDFASSRSRNTSVASQHTPNQNQPFPMQTLDFASSRSKNTSVASQQTAHQNQPFPM